MIAGADLLFSVSRGVDVPTLRSAAGNLVAFALLTSLLFAGARALFVVAGSLAGQASRWTQFPLTPLYFLLTYAVAEYYLAGELLAWMDVRDGAVTLKMPLEPIAEAVSLCIAACVTILACFSRKLGSWRMRIAIGGLAGLLLATIPFFLSRGTPSPGTRNVLLITADTLRMDVLGCYGDSTGGTPHIDGLAKEGTLFTRASAQGNVTAPSHSSILTSRYLRSHGVRYNAFALSGGMPTVAEILKEHGYRTGAFVHAFVLDSRFGLGRGFDTYVDAYTEKAFTRMVLMKFGLHRSYARHDQSRALHVNEYALPWVTNGGEDPFFAWVHYYDPHEPYNPPEEFRRRFTAGISSSLDPATIEVNDINEGRVHLEEADVAFIRGLYRGEVSFMDTAVGELLEGLEEAGLLASTLVIFTGDHGEELFDNVEHLGHDKIMFETTLHVPLILKGPAVPAGKRVEAPVETRYIPATILDWLGIAGAAAFEGESLLRTETTEAGMTTERTTFSESYSPEGTLEDVALRWDGLKCTVKGEGEKESFFALEEGLRETPLGTVDEAISLRARELLEAWRQEHPIFSSDSGPILDPRVREELKALGYLY